MPTKKKGAQPGNQNALKHGFYSSYFRPAEKRDFSRFDDETLESEINLLRSMLRRLTRGTAHKLDKLDEDDIPTARLMLDTAKALSTLKRTQAILTHGLSDVEEAILQAITELEDEL